MPHDTEHFKVSEFACKCCGKNEIKQEVIDMCEKIRKKIGAPVHVNSGYRCEKHNAEVGGVKGSNHTKGLAADLSCGAGAGKLFAAVADMKARGELPELDYGIYYVKKKFVHVDKGGKRVKYFEVRE